MGWGIYGRTPSGWHLGLTYSPSNKIASLMGGLFLARNQDLPGCKAQKTTIGEVITNVDAAHVDYIQALLASCLPVSEP